MFKYDYTCPKQSIYINNNANKNIRPMENFSAESKRTKINFIFLEQSSRCFQFFISINHQAFRRLSHKAIKGTAYNMR